MSLYQVHNPSFHFPSFHSIAFHIFFSLHPIHVCVSNVTWMWGHQAFLFEYVQFPIIIEGHWRCEGLITSMIGDSHTWGWFFQGIQTKGWDLLEQILQATI